MTDWADFGQVLLGRWPEQVSRWGREALAAYVQEVIAAGIDPATGIQAARAHTGEFPPSAGSLTKLAHRATQGPTPTFTEAQRIIRERVSTTLDYRNPTIGFDRLVAWCGEHHEAVARLAIALGPRGCRELPDPRAAHGSRTQAAERDWREACAGWEEDPRPGVALTEARRVAGVLDRGDQSTIAQARRELRA